MAEHAVLAPRYDELALCEEQHGAEACAPVEVAGGVPGEAAGSEAGVTQAGGSGFMPLFMETASCRGLGRWCRECRAGARLASAALWPSISSMS